MLVVFVKRHNLFDNTHALPISSRYARLCLLSIGHKHLSNPTILCRRHPISTLPVEACLTSLPLTQTRPGHVMTPHSSPISLSRGLRRSPTVPLGHGQLGGGGVAAEGVVEQLPLDVAQQAGGADPEHAAVEPGVAELLLDEDQPDEAILGGADAAGRLEADPVAGPLVVGADGAAHHHADGQDGVHTLLTCPVEMGWAVRRERKQPRRTPGLYGDITEQSPH